MDPPPGAETTPRSNRRPTPAEGYHLSEDLADRAIRMVLDQRQAAPDKPFFCYLATGAAHAPHQALRRVDRAVSGPVRPRLGGREARPAFGRQIAAGVVPDGTELTPRPPWVQDWESLSADEPPASSPATWRCSRAS